jgi:hypothetical protein
MNQCRNLRRAKNGAALDVGRKSILDIAGETSCNIAGQL